MANMSRRSFLQLFGASAAAVAGLGLVGCGGSSDSGSASKLEAVKKNGKLKAGVKKDVPGYGYLDPATNKYEGLEIDLCYQIAAKIFDVSYDDAKSKDLVEFTDVTPKTRGPLIDNDQLDIVCATYTITDERKQSWDFSTPYRTDYIGLLIKKGAISDLAGLDGKIIGVSQGSTTKDNITKMLTEQNVSATPQFQEFPDYPSIKSALDSATSTSSPSTAPSSAATSTTPPSCSARTSSSASRSTASPPRRTPTSPRPSTTSSTSASATAGSTRRSRPGTCSRPRPGRLRPEGASCHGTGRRA